MLPHRHLGKLWLILGEFTSLFAPMTSFVPTTTIVVHDNMGMSDLPEI